jgi:hypothetical protein
LAVGDAFELPGDPHTELAVAAWNVSVCEPSFVPRVSLQVGALGAVPRRAGGIGFDPGYRVDVPRAEREAASASACLSGAPQRHAMAEHRAGKTSCHAPPSLSA